MSETVKATKHSCGGPVFGKKTPGCPRCDELLAGAAPVAQAWRKRPTRAQEDDSRRRAIAAHYTPGSAHARGACGPVCTAFDW